MNRPSTTNSSSPSGQALSQEEALGLVLDNLEETFFLLDRDLRIVLSNEATKIKTQLYLGIALKPGTSILELSQPQRHAYLK